MNKHCRPSEKNEVRRNKMDEDVTKLTDEELQQRISGEETPTPEPTEEEAGETAEPVEEPVEAVVEEVKEPEENGEEQAPPPSRREQLRINDLLKKYGPPPEAPRTAPSQDRMDYAQQLEADPEVVKRLEADRQAAAKQAFDEGQQSANQRREYDQFYNNIRFDLPLVKDRLDRLDPEDVQELDDEYLFVTGADTTKGTVKIPNLSYAAWMNARLDQTERLAARMNAQTVKNVAKQAATTGLRPDGSSAKKLNLNQAPQNMSIEELYASIGQTPPKK